MKIKSLLALLLISAILVSFNFETEKTATAKESVVAVKHKDSFKSYADGIYNESGLKKANLRPEVFYKALQGFVNVKKEKLTTKKILAVIDFELPSTDKRLWIIDVESKKLLENTFVAHGKNSGNNRAVNFSNTPNSNMSSLGFYVADETYFGKHGLSLRLKGLDEKFNSNAYSRAIVMHGADYVCESFIKKHGRLGRSFGCPAVPRDKEKVIIETLKDGGVLYIHHSSKEYSSKFLQAVPDYN